MVILFTAPSELDLEILDDHAQKVNAVPVIGKSRDATSLILSLSMSMFAPQRESDTG